MHFKDRQEAGNLLADALGEHKGEDMVVYALPRGGVVLGTEIANRLDAPLDLIVTGQVGHPERSDYDVCAVTEDGHMVCSKTEISRLDPAWLTSELQKQQADAKRKSRKYAPNRSKSKARGKTAVIVDDGMATGLTLVAAIEDVKDRDPARVILAVPVIPGDVSERLKRYVDDIIALDTPALYLDTIDAYYDNFNDVGDKEIITMLKSSPKKPASSGRKR